MKTFNRSLSALASSFDKAVSMDHFRKYSIGFVAWHALPAIVPTLGKNIGGLETGAWNFAKLLAKNSEAEIFFL